MIYFCEVCCFVLDRSAFDEYFEYEKNICMDCLGNQRDEYGLPELEEGENPEGFVEMGFGETDEDYENRLEESIREAIRDRQAERIFDGKIEDEEETWPDDGR